MADSAINVRKAVIADHDTVSTIMNQVQEMHIHWRPDIYKPAKELLPIDGFRAALADDLFYVAEIDGKVVGVLGLEFRHIETPAHVTRDVLFIDSMAVDEAYRGRGVGHAFFDMVKKLAKQKNCGGIELQVNARNEQAYEMYTGYGFTEKSVTMELTDW